MFTGLIEEIGTVVSIVKAAKSAKISIHAKRVLEQLKIGDSISTNGVCLTVTDFTSSSFTVDVMAETMRRSNLCLLAAGDEINLERALLAGERFGGHIVSGHIDGTGVITDYRKEENAIWITIAASPDILKYIVHKGSITIDGISLTVAYIDAKVFQVSIIPHTRDVTTLLRKKVGAAVNLESDMIGKYIEKLLLSREQPALSTGIDMDFLSVNGFV